MSIMGARHRDDTFAVEWLCRLTADVLRGAPGDVVTLQNSFRLMECWRYTPMNIRQTLHALACARANVWPEIEREGAAVLVESVLRAHANGRRHAHTDKAAAFFALVGHFLRPNLPHAKRSQ